ncbi:MAG TPA: hypothetical protein DC049_18085, partial [Spirochaetia bacterium]|nr:hypothetical protein [Spirochaetia bacterium]
MKAPLPNYRHIRRYRQIAGILLKYGFSEVLSRFNAEPVFRIRSRKKADQAIIRKTAAERFRLVLEDLGPAFIKFGQMLSLREDLLPSAFISELCKLQTGAAELPFSVLRPVVEK